MKNLDYLNILSSFIDREAMLTLASKLIEKNTVNPPGNEYLVKDILLEYLKKIGARIKFYEPVPGRLNVLGYIGEGSPVVAIVSHMDVVPPGDGWNSDPFSPVVKDGKIYGRGALDNKGPFAASWAGIKALLDAKIPLRGTIVLGALADEERGSRYGMQHLLEKDFHPDFCIIPDGGKLNEMVVGEKGRIEVCIRTEGKSAHASEPQKGDNAIYKMTAYLNELKNFRLKYKHHHLFGPATINLGEIKGGQASNVVPDNCEVTLDIRYPLGTHEDEILNDLRALALKCGVVVEIEKRGFSIEPHLIDLEHPLVKIFKDIAVRIGVSLEVGTMGGITLAKNLYFNNVPAVVHSPTTESVAHQANEYVEIENLITCAKIWAGVVANLLKVD